MPLLSLLPPLLLALACGPAIRMPGPLGPVGRAAPPAPDRVAFEERATGQTVASAPAQGAAAPKAKPAPPQEVLRTADPAPPSKVGAEIAGAALWYLKTTPSLERNDCSGLVMAVYDRAGFPIEGSSESFWEEAFNEGRVHLNKRPAPGDIAFFDNTYDKNRNKRVDDALSHVAVVVSVDDDGTIHMVHNSAGKPIRSLVMNLDKPDVAMKGDKQLNEYLRALNYGGPDDPRLAGQLWRGFATPAGAPRVGPGSAAAVANVASEGNKSPRAPAEPAKPSPAHPLVPRVVDGRRLSAADLDGLDCESLWQLRNSVFARHGYTFKGGFAATWFATQPWYVADPKVAYATVNDHLTRADRKNVARIKAREDAKSCEVPRKGV